ncbi:hypothetical protein WR25_21194 [Diploscapter pachys]|uniref:Uncharacterized protein n=1 Tax=Diploscapter pachys TaxID=2018661 RepID=A0A2A2M3A2_9BILA|nr:hypothetical protein WR25_21194 [Diploscapter pachys]
MARGAASALRSAPGACPVSTPSRATAAAYCCSICGTLAAHGRIVEPARVILRAARLHRPADLAEQADLIARRQAGREAVGAAATRVDHGAVGQRERAATAAQVLVALIARRPGQRRQQRRAALHQRLARLPQPPDRLRDIGVGATRLLDQLAEHGVVEVRPPARQIFRTGRRRHRIGGRNAQLGGRLRAIIGADGAARQGQRGERRSGERGSGQASHASCVINTPHRVQRFYVAKCHVRVISAPETPACAFAGTPCRPRSNPPIPARCVAHPPRRPAPRHSRFPSPGPRRAASGQAPPSARPPAASRAPVPRLPALRRQRRGGSCPSRVPWPPAHARRATSSPPPAPARSAVAASTTRHRPAPARY